MYCPICSQPLQQKADAYICAQHGLLLSGAVLYDIRAGSNKDLLVHDSDDPVALTRPHALVCPHCDSDMVTVNYINTGVDIDSCANCQYRWLDKGELVKIVEHKPELTPAQLLEVEELDRASGVGYTPKDDKIAHFTLYRTLGPFAVSVLNPGENRGPLPLIAGAGIAGVIRMMLHSWLYRILLLIILIIFGLLAWYIYSELT